MFSDDNKLARARARPLMKIETRVPTSSSTRAIREYIPGTIISTNYRID